MAICKKDKKMRSMNGNKSKEIRKITKLKRKGTVTKKSTGRPNPRQVTKKKRRRKFTKMSFSRDKRSHRDFEYSNIFIFSK